MSDGGPITVTVDIVNAFGTDEYRQAMVTTHQDWVTHNIWDRESDLANRQSQSSFGYRWVGRLDNGIHVLHTSAWGGGSGHFDGLLWLRFHTDHAIDSRGKAYPRLLLTVIRSANLGDRAVRGVRLEDNTAWVKPSGRYDAQGNTQTPSDPDPPSIR